MATPVTYEQVLELVKQLPAADLRRLVREASRELRNEVGPKDLTWTDLLGSLPGPWFGCDAQEHISRERREGQERREIRREQ